MCKGARFLHIPVDDSYFPLKFFYSHPNGCEVGVILKRHLELLTDGTFHKIPSSFRPGEGLGRFWRESEVEPRPLGLNSVLPQFKPYAAGTKGTSLSRSNDLLMHVSAIRDRDLSLGYPAPAGIVSLSRAVAMVR